MILLAQNTNQWVAVLNKIRKILVICKILNP